MTPEKRVIFRITGDAIVKLLKERGALPEDAECITMFDEWDGLHLKPISVTRTMMAHIMITSETCEPIPEGGVVPVISIPT